MVWIARSEAEATAIKEIITLPPRAAAVVGAAFVHDRIAYAVAERFPVEGNTKDNLFKENGELSSFFIQAKLAYTLGIFSKLAFQDTMNVATLRNRFAHRLDVTSFDDDPISSICKQFKLIERHLFPRGTDEKAIPKDISPRSFVEDLPGILADNRKRFQFTVMLLTSSFAPMNVVGAPRPRAPRVTI